MAVERVRDYLVRRGARAEYVSTTVAFFGDPVVRGAD
jgi:hypothetical protein